MRTAAAVCVALLILSACSSEDDTPGDTSPPSSDPETSVESPAATGDDELRQAVETYSVAFLSGDGATAYGLLSTRCQDRLPLSEFASVVEQAADIYGPQAITSLEVTVNGPQAQATYAYADASLNQDNEPWVNEDGWRVDDC